MAIKRCIHAFVFWSDGVPRVVPAGELVDESDVAYRDHKTHFETLRPNRDAPAEKPRRSERRRPVERATAEPEEKRRLTEEAPSEDK